MALVGPHRVFIVPTIAHATHDDFVRRFVLLLVAYARDVEGGHLPGEPGRFLPGRAERYVRAALLPERPFQRLWSLGDEELARIFRVPLEQIVSRRHEIPAVYVADCRGTRRAPRLPRHRPQ